MEMDFFTTEDETSQFGTVDVGFDFYVNRENLKENNINTSSSVLYSAFTGVDVGTQIKGDKLGRGRLEWVHILLSSQGLGGSFQGAKHGQGGTPLA
jgi:hypothetical protein